MGNPGVFFEQLCVRIKLRKAIPNLGHHIQNLVKPFNICGSDLLQTVNQGADRLVVHTNLEYQFNRTLRESVPVAAWARRNP